ESFARLVRAGIATGPIDVHLKVDTGMGRLGVTMPALPALAEKLAAYPEVRVRGLMTHLACADAVEDTAVTEPLARFDEASALLARRGVEPEVRHAANSAALFRSRAIFDAV